MPRNPTLPCSVCGHLGWPGNGTLPAGLYTCRPCRRVRGSAEANQERRPERSVTCGSCGEQFTTRHPTAKFCGPPCRTTVNNHRRRPLDKLRKGRPYRRLRAQVLVEESTCWLCDGTFYGEWPDPWATTLDHVVPLSAGGAPLERSNVRAAHTRCNAARGDRPAPVKDNPEFYFAGVGWLSVYV